MLIGACNPTVCPISLDLGFVQSITLLRLQGCYVKEFQFRFCDPHDPPTIGCGGCQARERGNHEVCGNFDIISTTLGPFLTDFPGSVSSHSRRVMCATWCQRILDDGLGLAIPMSMA